MRLTAVLLFFFSFFYSFSQTPDIIITNGKIFTSDEKQLYVEAVAIKGNRISARGSKADIAKLAGPNTMIMDVQGKTVVPGFNDAHYHHNPIEKVYHIPFPQDGREPSWQELQDSIVAAVKRVPKGSFIYSEMGMAVGTDSSIDRTVLDKLAPDHPLLIHAYWGHVSYFNSAFIKAVKFAETQPDIKGGWFGRMPGTNVLNGRAYENTTNYLYHQLPTTGELFKESLKQLGQQALYFGVTSIQNMCTGAPPEQFLQYLKQQPLPIRFRLIRWGEVKKDESLFLPAKNLRSALPRVEVSGTKWMLDGTPIERNAAWTVAYKDQPSWKGKINFTLPEIQSMLKELSVRKDQPMFHAVGDATIGTVLNELKKSSSWQGRRVRFEHGDGLMPEMFDDAKKMGIIVVQNPSHLMLPDIWPQRFDGKILANAQPLRSLLAAGIPVALGSDGPLNPYLNIMFACIRPYRPDEAITVEQAVIAYTKTSAYAEFKDDKGMIAPGQLADLVVLSEDIFTIPLQQLPGVHSVMTMVDGKVVYGKDGYRVGGVK